MIPGAQAPIVYLNLEQYLAIAAEALEVGVEELALVVDENLADSALHAPQAGYDDVDLYPEFAFKAAVLCSRLVRNHPLPDGNKRAAFEAMRVFLKLNGMELDYSSPSEAAEIVRRLAAREINEDGFAVWVDAGLWIYRE